MEIVPQFCHLSELFLSSRDLNILGLHGLVSFSLPVIIFICVSVPYIDEEWIIHGRGMVGFGFDQQALLNNTSPLGQLNILIVNFS